MSELTEGEVGAVIAAAVKWRDDWRTTDDDDLIEAVQGAVQSHTDPLREQVETLTMRLGERDEDVRRETQRADEAERWRSSLEEENETLRRRLEDAGRALTELERQIKTERLTRGKVEWTD